MVSGPTNMKKKNMLILKEKKKARMKFDMISLKENLGVLPKENKLNMSFWFQHSFFQMEHAVL